MTRVYVWHLCAVLSLLAAPGEQRGQPPAVPQILRVYSEEDRYDHGAWQMNIEWKDGFTRISQSQKASYELRIFHTDYRTLVHNETVEVVPDLTGVYHWGWTSPIPLRCTSHSVQLRLRKHNETSEWSDEYILEGNDRKDEDKVYPQNRRVLVNEGIVFCCILNSDKVKDSLSSEFTIQISNRTFITKPVRYPHRTPLTGKDVFCGNSGATYYTGYPPDVHNLTCETRDLSSVECSWSRGPKHGFVGEAGNMRYSINGRDCSYEKCVLEQSVGETVTNWTLTAENDLGKQTLTDVAVSKHRVRLKAPEQTRVSAVGELTAELEWIWGIRNYRTFPMTCQVRLNGLTVNETFHGTGLRSALLKDLQISTNYKAQVRCGAREHFYTWGDWSDNVTFRTKPDSSKAADVWMQVLGGQTSVVWKPFSSDYKITSFELLLGNSTKPVTRPPDEFCYKVEPASTPTQSVISVSAVNSEWTSPPSTITLPNPAEGVAISAINASNGGFYLSWEPAPGSSCGYVVDWYPTYGAEPCAVEWIRVSSGVYSSHVHSDFKEGVRYTLSVYACTPGAPELLQRREGYVRELAPSAAVQKLKANQLDSDVCLSWEDVLKDKQRGFIQGYNVSYSSLNGKVNKWKVIQVADPSSRECKFSLHPDTYRFTVKPLTSAGEGPEASVTLAMNPPIEKIIIIVICVLAAATASLAILYRKRNWLKSVLYPDIPKPGLSEEWHSKGLHQCHLIDKLLIAERDVLKICYPEPSSQCKADLQKENEETQLLYSPGSQDSPLSETWEMIPKHQILNPITYSTPVIPINPVAPMPYSNPVAPMPYSNPVTLVTYTNPITPITVDFSYMEVPCAAVQNPTYNIPVEHLPVPPLATDTVMTPGYIPQKRNITQQHQSSGARR